MRKSIQKYQFIENDVSGETTFDVIAEANKFNQWMYDTIRPHCKGNVLEIGSGIGNISEYFLKDNFNITLTDIRTGYCEKLRKIFGDYPNLLSVEHMDLVDEEFESKFSTYFNKFDTIFALNVVEHIRDDILAIRNCKKLLTDTGNLIILVPSYQILFNQFDIELELEHYRRYNKKSLTHIFKKAGMEVTHKQYFNMIGIFGWYFSGKILKRKTIPKDQMVIFNTLVPIFKIIDKMILNSIGLSTIGIGKKNNEYKADS